jgi:hypothetical protein
VNHPIIIIKKNPFGATEREQAAAHENMVEWLRMYFVFD